MSRDWKPGDVAVVTLTDGTEVRALYTFRGGSPWVTVATASYEKGIAARPLVVIDPEDFEQVSRLAHTIAHTFHSTSDNIYADGIQAALREFAEPTQPKPNEPTGRYAVVEDAEDQEWVAIDPPNPGYRWQLLGKAPNGLTMYSRWDDIAAVRVLSEGVTP